MKKTEKFDGGFLPIAGQVSPQMRRTVENYAAERAIPIGQVIREALDLFFEIEEYDLYGTEQ